MVATCWVHSQLLQLQHYGRHAMPLRKRTVVNSTILLVSISGRTLRCAAQPVGLSEVQDNTHTVHGDQSQAIAASDAGICLPSICDINM